MEVMLSGRPLYGAGCLAPGTGDLVNRLPPQAGRSPWVPLNLAGKVALGNGCCWRRAPLTSAEGGRALELTDGGVCLAEDELFRFTGHTAEAEGEPYRGAGHTAEAEGEPYHGAGHTALGEPYRGAGHTAEAEGEPYRGAGHTAEAEAEPCCGAGHTAEAEGEPYSGAGHTTEGEPYCGDGHTAEAEGEPYCGAGHTAEAEAEPYCGAGHTAEAEGEPYSGAGHTAEAEAEPYCGAGHTTEGEPYCGDGHSAEAEGEPYRGAGHTAEAEAEPYCGAGHTAEAEGEPYSGAGHKTEGEPYCGAGHTAEAEGETYCGAGHSAEAEGESYRGASHRQDGRSKDHEICVFTELTEPQGLTEPHKQQWRCQNIQAGEGSATTMNGPSETHPHPALEPTTPPSAAGLLPAGLVTVATAAAMEVLQAQLCETAQAGEEINASDCEEHKQAEENDDEFGTFEKAGNLVQWAEFAGPLRLECEDPHSQSGATASRGQEEGEDVAASRVWRRLRSENAATEPDADETAQRRASLHGSSNRAAESGETGCPLISAAPSHTLTSEDGWRAFHTEDSRSQENRFDAFSLNKQETAQCGVGGEWWSTGALEHHTFQMTSPSEPSLGKGGLEAVFHSCFPAASSASSSRAIPPLVQLLGRSEEKGGEGILSAQASDLWDLLQDVDEAVGLKHKWVQCQSRRRLLASLCVDPAKPDTSAGNTRTLGSSPLSSRETKMELHPSPVILGRDSKELMLIKKSVPQHQTNGFSPTHRIQAFFYHWTQADRNGRSKTLYDINKNFMA